MRRIPRAIAVLCLVFGIGGCEGPTEHRLDGLDVPPGFTIRVFSTGMPGARSLARGAQGTIILGSHAAGNVYALRDEDGDGHAEVVHKLIRDAANAPNGVAFLGGDLYAAFTDRIVRLPRIESRLSRPPEPEVVTRLSEYRLHAWRYLAAGPDGFLYVSFGAPCNACTDYGEIRRAHTPKAVKRGWLRAACVTAWGSTGARKPARSGSPTPAATCSATTARPTSSTGSHGPASTSASPSAMAPACPIRSSATRRPARSMCRPSSG